MIIMACRMYAGDESNLQLKRLAEFHSSPVEQNPLNHTL